MRPAGPKQVGALGRGTQAAGIEGHGLRAEGGRAHIHGHTAIGLKAGRDDPGLRANADGLFAGEPPIAHETRKAPRSVTALLHLIAIGIEDAIDEVDVGRIGRLDHQNLIGADTEMPIGKQTLLRRAQGERLTGCVEHPTIVARAMHLGKPQFHGVIIAQRTLR